MANLGYNNFMKITRFRKYISWNVMAAMGYICMIISVIFMVMLLVATSGTTIRPDINEYFYEYIIKHLLIPYIAFYKFQLFLVGLCLLSSIVEHRYYKTTEQYGLRLFGNHEKIYSMLFVTGLAINFLPLYLFFIIIISWIMRFI